MGVGEFILEEECYALAYPNQAWSPSSKFQVCNQKSSSKTRSLSYGASQCSGKNQVDSRPVKNKLKFATVRLPVYIE